MASTSKTTEYDIFKNVALGVSFKYFSIDVDADDSDWRGRIDYEYYGPALYIAAIF